jgi:hypothetical protein
MHAWYITDCKSVSDRSITTCNIRTIKPGEVILLREMPLATW